MVFTPCDFAFPTNGVKAEATPNTDLRIGKPTLCLETLDMGDLCEKTAAAHQAAAHQAAAT